MVFSEIKKPLVETNGDNFWGMKVNPSFLRQTNITSLFRFICYDYFNQH